MAETCTRKLIVEVCNAKNLMPKDGQGTASAFATVDFDGQRRRTKTKFRDLNPEWDEKLEFLVHDTESMATEILEISLYNDKKTVWRRDSCLLPVGETKRVSQIKGELGLKVYYIDEDPPAPPAEQKPEAKAPETEENKPAQEAKPEDEKKEEEKKKEEPKTESNKEENKEEESQVHHHHKRESKRQRRQLLQLSDRSRSAYDLVDRMPFLYVRVVKAKAARMNPKAQFMPSS
ncbi:C2 domain-containing family protein [Salix suchowensis]|nr:C2 domain-containing family protein [Salix suchowensis]